MPKFMCVVFVGVVVANAFLFLLLHVKISSRSRSDSLSQNLYQNYSQDSTSTKTQPHRMILKDYNDTLLQEVWNNVPVLDAPNLPRLMSTFHLKSSLKLLDEVTKFFDEYNIEYVMCYGTLLGSYVAHSVLAWDDDIDIVMHARHQPFLQQLVDKGLLKDISISHMICCHKEYENDDTSCDRAKNKFWFTDSYWKTDLPWSNPSLTSFSTTAMPHMYGCWIMI